jgi:hypothetical protein
MYAAYLYILRALDCAAVSRFATSPDPEREIANGRWPNAPVAECDSPAPARLAKAESILVKIARIGKAVTGTAHWSAVLNFRGRS